MLLVGARSINIAIVVWAAALARIGLARRIGAHDALIAHARSSMAPQILGSIGNAAVIDHAVLHRTPNELTLAGELALIESGEDADRSVEAGAGVADRRPGFDRAPVGLAGDRHGPAGRLRDHVESEVILVGAVVSEALDRDIDDARVDFAHHVVAKAEPFDDAGGEILGKDIGLFDQPAQNGAPLVGLQIGGDAALVGVEQHEVLGIDALFVGRRAAALLAPGRLLDLDHLGAEPCQGQGAGRPGLELGQVDYPNTVQSASLQIRGLTVLGRWVVRHSESSWSYFVAAARGLGVNLPPGTLD